MLRLSLTISLTINLTWHYLTQSLFYDKVLGIACNLLNSVPKVRNRLVVWVQNGSKCIGCLPHDCMADWELRLAAVAQHHRRVSYSISPVQEKIRLQNLKHGFS